MSFINPAAAVAYKAVADLSGDQYTFVKHNANNGEMDSSGANDDSLGVLMTAPKQDEHGEVHRPGNGAKIRLAATLARGAKVKPNADGHAVVATTGQRYEAILEEGGVDNDIVPCLVWKAVVQ